MTLQRSEMDSTGQIAPIRVSFTSSRLKELLIGQVLRNTRACVRVEPDIFEKFKINISARSIHTKLSTRKCFNTKNLLLI